MREFQMLRYWADTPKQLSFLDQTERFFNAETEHILNYTSNIIKITQNGTPYFFKEAKPRPTSLRACVYESIDCFFDDIVCNPSLKEKVLKSLQNRRCFQRLVNMGYKNVRGDRFHRYLVSSDEGCLGLPASSALEEKAQLRKLVFYLYGELQNWFYNRNVKAGDLQTFSAIRALSTQELAKLLGLGDLIPRCDFVKLKLNGKIRYGILSEHAAGDTLTACPFEQRAKSVTPQLLRSLTNLNLLDVLSRDNDHRVGNYHVVANDRGEYCSILSYDNDSPDTFGLSANVGSVNLIGCSGFLDRKGLINRAHLDQAAASALLRLEKAHLDTFKPFLSNLQIRFLWKRIGKVQKAIRKTLSFRNDLLLMPNDWNREHLKQDLSAIYGKTYLASLLSDCYYESGLHDFDTL